LDVAGSALSIATSDSEPYVRAAALTYLRKDFSSVEQVCTSEYLGRIVQDEDNEVRVEAAKLLCKILKSDCQKFISLDCHEIVRVLV
jgi:hypothetical protein